MKKLSFVALFVTVAHSLFAQDCKNFYYLLNNAEVEMTIYNNDNKAVGKNIYNVLSVNKEGTNTVSDFTSTFKDDKDKVITSGKGKFKCDGDNVFIDMQMSMPNIPQIQQLKMEAGTGNSYLSYPSSLKEGASLPDGSFEMKGKANGMDMALQYKVKDRKVTGKEKITTTAGSWDCYKITYNINLQMEVMGMAVPLDMQATEWFAPGFGVVKTESYRENKPVGTMLITGLKK